jgi:NADH-quinone oxidoreductase subunit E
MTEPLMTRINELVIIQKIKKSALLPVLHEVQDAHDNWLSVELMDKVANFAHLPIEVLRGGTFIPCII